ncbi:hypothetical protein ES703_86485 [subsurface metagenome]
MRIRVKSGSIRDRALSITLIAAVAAAIAMLGYTISNPPAEPFTEFYILGSSGEAVDYPKELVVGEEARVIVGIINREQETVSYSVEISIDGAMNNKVGPVELNHNEKWEEIVSFTPTNIGDNQRVEFRLHWYKNGEPVFKYMVYLEPVDVKEQR